MTGATASAYSFKNLEGMPFKPAAFLLFNSENFTSPTEQSSFLLLDVGRGRIPSEVLSHQAPAKTLFNTAFKAYMAGAGVSHFNPQRLVKEQVKE